MRSKVPRAPAKMTLTKPPPADPGAPESMPLPCVSVKSACLFPATAISKHLSVPFYLSPDIYHRLSVIRSRFPVENISRASPRLWKANPERQVPTSQPKTANCRSARRARLLAPTYSPNSSSACSACTSPSHYVSHLFSGSMAAFCTISSLYLFSGRELALAGLL